MAKLSGDGAEFLEALEKAEKQLEETHEGAPRDPRPLDQNR